MDPADWIETAANTSPERLFLRTPGRMLTYALLREQTGRFVTALKERGVETGDRVAVQVDKSVEAVLLYIACLRMGAVYVPINVANTPHEVEHYLRDSQPRVAVIRPADRALLEPYAMQTQVRHVDTLGDDGEGSLPELVRRSDEWRDPAWTGSENSLAAIVYTSGTTGRSKGAMLTRANLASNAAALAEAWRFTGADVLLHVLPLFHVHGLFAAINTVLASASGVLLSPRFDAESTLQHLASASVFMGVPTYYTRLLQQTGLNREVTAHVRLFVSGSAPLLADTHREFSRRTGHIILERYGMTETLMNTSNPYDGVRKPGSVGPPLPGVEVRVIGASGAGESSAEVTGNIEVRGPNVFAGYWRDPEKTRDEFSADGWFKTGDVGCIDTDGYVHIVGRAKDLVISGGYNVYPREVEMELDALFGVMESAVFGVQHPDFGEAVTAVVVRQPACRLSEADVINSMQMRLARYKVPKRVIFVEQLPRNAMGKVQKNVLRSDYATLYGASAPPRK
jgi:malonyl-CoA/methylmalonyl-CoA synthetase